jgi:sulfofructose kinase
MNHAPTYDVIGLGCVCWDFVTIVRRYPALDEKQELVQLLQQGGGPTATGVVAVARLGGRAAIWGRVGDDEFGQKCAAEFVAEGVDTGHLEMAPGRTTQFAFCVAEAGSGLRSIFWKPGNMGKLDPQGLDRAALLDCKCFLIGAHHSSAAIAAANAVREAGIPVVLDLERPGPDDEGLLAASDYPILPADYVRAQTGMDDAVAAGRQVHEALGRLLIVTLGVEGAVAFRNGQAYHQPAFIMEEVVDTTGAGDVYHGAFAYGLALGKGLEENMRFAAAVAALKCRALGGRTGIPNTGEVEELLGTQAA